MELLVHSQFCLPPELDRMSDKTLEFNVLAEEGTAETNCLVFDICLGGPSKKVMAMLTTVEDSFDN